MTRLQKEIRTISELIRTKYKPEKIILFGSAARGEYEEGSDLDFFVVKNTRLPRHKRIEYLYGLLYGANRANPVDFIAYTPKELKVRQDMGDFFVGNILEEGKVLYESKKH